MTWARKSPGTLTQKKQSIVLTRYFVINISFNLHSDPRRWIPTIVSVFPRRKLGIREVKSVA